MVAEGTPAAAPTLADQVSKLYDLIAGYHATHLLEIARELGVWEALAQHPGLTSEELAARLGTHPFSTDVLCRTAFSFGLLEREGAGWRMAPHFDQILGNPESSFYLARAPRVHMVVGEDYREYVGHFRAGTTKPYQEHGEAFMREVAEALKTLPRIFLDLVLPRLPGLGARLEDGGRVLDVGCGGGWAVVQIAERFPETYCVGIDVEPYSIELARQLIVERGLTDRCEAHARSVDQLGEDGTYDVATSFLVVHEIPPALKPAAFAAVARALKPGGYFLIFDEVYPETDEGLRTMPTRFAALAQWYEVTWGNVVDTRSALHALCRQAGTPGRRGDQLLPLPHHPRGQAAAVPGPMSGAKPPTGEEPLVRKFKLQVQTSVDGYMAGPNGEMDWMTYPWTDDMNAYVDALTEPVDCIVLGRKLAEGFIPAWAAGPEGEDQASIDWMNNTPKVVISNTLTESPWENAVVAGGDLAETVNKLKAQPGGDMIAYGGGTLVSRPDRQGPARRAPPVRQPDRDRRRACPCSPTSAPTSGFASSPLDRSTAGSPRCTSSRSAPERGRLAGAGRRPCPRTGISGGRGRDHRGRVLGGRPDPDAVACARTRSSGPRHPGEIQRVDQQARVVALPAATGSP